MIVGRVGQKSANTEKNVANKKERTKWTLFVGENKINL